MIALESYVEKISDNDFIEILEDVKDSTEDLLLQYKADNIIKLIASEGYSNDVKVKIIELQEELENISRFEDVGKDISGQQQLFM